MQVAREGGMRARKTGASARVCEHMNDTPVKTLRAQGGLELLHRAAQQGHAEDLLMLCHAAPL